MFFMANENINMLIWFITLLLISLFMFVGSCSGKLFSALINLSSSVFLVFFSRGRGLQKYVKWKMWLVRLWLIDAHLLTCREGWTTTRWKLHSGWKLHRNTSPRVLHVWGRRIYLFSFIFYFTENQAFYMAKVFMFNYVWKFTKKYAKIFW